MQVRSIYFLASFLIASCVYAELTVGRASFAPLVKKVDGSVVNIFVEKKVVVQPTPVFEDPFLELFGGRGVFGFSPSTPKPMEGMQKSLGSGVIIDASGIILTNVHVIKNATKIYVKLSDGHVFSAELVAKDEKLDLALLKIDSGSLKLNSAVIGNPDESEVGDIVLAIGNPFGIGNTVTTGIISAKARFGGFIQTDAAINSGNSGGALLNANGELIGINNFILSKDGTNTGVGFAIPVHMIKPIMDAFKRDQKEVVRGWVGVVVENISSKLQKSLKNDIVQGAVVTFIHALSPASGIQVGDIIRKINGYNVVNDETFYYRFAGVPVGEKVALEIYRGGRVFSVTVNSIEPPASSVQRKSIDGKNILSGITVANLSPALEVKMDLDYNENGVVVLEVDPQSLVSRMVTSRDILYTVNNQRVLTVEALTNILQKEEIVSFQVLRDQQLIEYR